MTMPRSLTSSRYTGAPALRSLERTSVVSIITSRPIHASGIGPPCGAAGLCLSIMVHSSARYHPRPRIPLPNQGSAYFLEPPRHEVRRTTLPRTRANRVKPHDVAILLCSSRYLREAGPRMRLWLGDRSLPVRVLLYAAPAALAFALGAGGR